MSLLEKIKVTKLKRIEIQGGDVLHGIKNSDDTFHGFGEAYFSYINPKEIKAWKLHTQMTMNLIVPSGNVRFIFYEHSISSFKEEIIGDINYSRLTVPPGIWFGFQGLEYKFSSLVFNLSNIRHDPNEVKRKKIPEIDFKW